MRAFVVRIVPEVSGKVVEVAVHNDQIVRTGDLLYRIDPTPFGLAVERAKAKLNIVVPITLVGLALLMARYGGLGKLRTARS